MPASDAFVSGRRRQARAAFDSGSRAPSTLVNTAPGGENEGANPEDPDMAARKKTTRKKTTRKKTARRKPARKKRTSRRTPRQAFEANLKALERQLPARLARGVRELRRNMKDLERQIDKARVEREARWRRLETQIRTDAARALRRLERAVEPRKPARKKTATRKKSARKKSVRKKAGTRSKKR